jgi:hypothetical protein
MAVNNNPIFVGTPIVQQIFTTEATARGGDGGTYRLLFTPGTDGSRVERVTAVLSGTMSASTSAMAVRVYIKNVDNGILYLYRESVLPTSTPSVSVLGANTTFNFNGGLCLGTQSEIWVGQSTYAGAADRVSWIAEGGRF